MSQKRRIRKIVYAHFDALYKHCVANAKSFDRNTVPFNTLKALCDRAKLKTTDAAFSEFSKNFNTVLDSLYTECVDYATKNKADVVPLTYIKICVSECKTSFA